eukprot:11090902-Lingulodinium_polyedra.AAC.1
MVWWRSTPLCFARRERAGGRWRVPLSACKCVHEQYAVSVHSDSHPLPCTLDGCDSHPLPCTLHEQCA